MRCDALLAHGSRFGGDSAVAFTVTGLLLAVPAMLLPFVEVSKFQAAHASYAFSGVRALWDAHMRLLGIWVFLCGVLVPCALLIALAALLLPPRLGGRTDPPEWVLRVARAFQQWAMPEVHVLAVLVAFAKLGSLVNVHPGSGLWCYVGMTVCILTAWRGYELCHAPRLRRPEHRAIFQTA